VTHPLTRRGLLIGGSGLIVGAAATEGADLAAGGPGPSKELTPGEDLMREHGVLKRILLAYRNVLDRQAAHTTVPTAAVHDGATIIHDYIEGFHEGLEEAYVFPPLRTAGQLVATVDTLLVQHARGRRLTQRILDTTGTATLTPAAGRQLTSDLTAFLRMYEPHEAREDTVVFPALRQLLSATQLRSLADTFVAEEDKQFGPDAFAEMVDRVAGIEKTLGIDDLSQFTPTV
jgi:hemerythrin-like domain-containing protein